MAVAPVQVATTQEFHNTTSVSFVSGSVTITAGADYLICFTHNAGAPVASGMTYNGVALTYLGESTATFYSTQKKVRAWGMASPPTGSAYTLRADWDIAMQDMGFTWATFSGVGSIGTVYSNAPALNSTSANGSVTVSDWATGDYAVGSIVVNQAITAGDTEMGRYSSIANNDNYVSSEYQTADGALNWTHGADIWAAIGLALKPATATTYIAPLPYIKRQAVHRASTY